ncbi:MAG TPA: hypothetical protein ENI86_01575 [Acidimicrobiales bacterium]|nr:hypothetical protein [Acidimicrobiales bacterium]
MKAQYDNQQLRSRRYGVESGPTGGLPRVGFRSRRHGVESGPTGGIPRVGFLALFAAVALLASACTSSADAGPREVDLVMVTTTTDGGGSAVVPDTVGQGSGPADAGVAGAGGLSDVVVPTRDPSTETTTTVPVPVATSAPTTTVAPTTSSTTSTSVVVTYPTQPSTTTTLAPNQTTTTQAPPPPVDVGLVVASGDPSGDAFTTGVQAAVGRVNGTGGAGGRTVRLTVCAYLDASSAGDCARMLRDVGVEAVVEGPGGQGEAVRDVLRQAGIAVVGGVAESLSDGGADQTALTLGGPITALSGLAQLVVDEGHLDVTIVHDDTPDGFNEVQSLMEPVLSQYGVSITTVAVPPGTTDPTALLATAIDSGPEAWVVVTGPASCGGVIDTLFTAGVVAPTYYVHGCAAPSVLDSRGPAAADAWFQNEIWTRAVLGLGSPSEQETYDTVSGAIAAMDPARADDEWALMGYVSLTSTADAIARGGSAGALVGAEDTTSPSLLGVGTQKCGQSPSFPAVCSGSIFMTQWSGSGWVGSIVTANGLAGL